MNGGDAQAVMDFMMAYLPGWIGYMVYVLFILAVVITGIVLFIVFRKRFALDPGQIPKGQRFKTVICNPGMLWLLHFLDRDDPSADVPGDRADAVGNFSSVPVKTFRRG